MLLRFLGEFDDGGALLIHRPGEDKILLIVSKRLPFLERKLTVVITR